MMKFEFDDYQEIAHSTAVYPEVISLPYLALGLNGEAGEVAEKVKKILRGDVGLDRNRGAIIDELGDCLWYIAEIATIMGVNLSSVAMRNTEKLADRREREAIKGNGDNR